MALKYPTAPVAAWAHASASQLKTFGLCPTKWYTEKIQGITDDTPAPPLEHGKAVHAQLEAWYRDGAAPKDPSAYLALDYLPPRGPGLLIEHPITMWVEAAGVAWNGAIDLVNTRDPSRPVIWDHKTSASREYAKTPEDLSRDVQLNAYAYYVAAFTRAERFRLVHGYLGTRKADFYTTVADVTRDDVLENWAGIEKTVSTLAGYAKETNRDEIPRAPNTKNGCWAYNRRCPYGDLCGIPKERPIEAMPSLSDLLKTPTTPAAPATEGAIVVVGSTGVLPPDAPAPSASPPVASAPVEAPKPKRGKAKKAEPNLEGAEDALKGLEVLNAVAGHTTIVVPAETIADAAEALASVSKSDALHADDHEPLELWIDAVVSFKGAPSTRVTYLEDVIAKASEEICAAQGVDDLRLLKYGEGKALLANYLRKHPPTGVVVARSGEMAEVALEVLKPLAWAVTQGVR